MLKATHCLICGALLQLLSMVATMGNTSGYPDPVEVPVATEYALSELDIFNSGQPTTFSFRDDYLGQQGYSVFKETISQSFGHGPKMFSEERVASIANQPFMAQYAVEHPEKMLLCHYNGKQIKVMRHTEFADFFPGHWLYYPGSSLSSGTSASATTITVDNSANFRVDSVVAFVPRQIGKKPDRSAGTIPYHRQGLCSGHLRGHPSRAVCRE